MGGVYVPEALAAEMDETQKHPARSRDPRPA
jgi:hypothetical protein